MSKTVRLQDYEDGALDVTLTYTGDVYQIESIYSDLKDIRDKFSKKCTGVNNIEHDVSILKENQQRHSYNFEVPKEEADNVKDCLESLGFNI